MFFCLIVFILFAFLFFVFGLFETESLYYVALCPGIYSADYSRLELRDLPICLCLQVLGLKENTSMTGFGFCFDFFFVLFLTAACKLWSDEQQKYFSFLISSVPYFPLTDSQGSPV